MLGQLAADSSSVARMAVDVTDFARTRKDGMATFLIVQDPNSRREPMKPNPRSPFQDILLAASAAFDGHSAHPHTAGRETTTRRELLERTKLLKHLQAATKGT